MCQLPRIFEIPNREGRRRWWLKPTVLCGGSSRCMTTNGGCDWTGVGCVRRWLLFCGVDSEVWSENGSGEGETEGRIWVLSIMILRWIPVQAMIFLLYDVDRVLRGGGFLWADRFFSKEVDLGKVYGPLIGKLGYKKKGLSVNQVVLTSLIKAYSKTGIIEGARTIYNKMKELPGGPDVVASNSILNLYADLGMVSEAKSIFDHLQENHQADAVSFATMMYVYKNMGMIDEAIQVAKEMKDSGLLTDCPSFNKAMACYATSGNLIECGEMLHEMIVTQKLSPTTGTFKVLFTVLKKGGIPAEAVEQLEFAYQESKPYAKQAVVTAVFSVVGLHIYALDFFQNFIKSETGLDLFVYNVAIYVFGGSGRIDDALKMFMRMQDEGLEADVVTYIYLVGCYGKAGMLEGVKRVYSKLKYGEIDRSASLFMAIIDAYKYLNRNDLAELVNQEMNLVSDSEPLPSSEDEDELDETSVSLSV